MKTKMIIKMIKTPKTPNGTAIVCRNVTCEHCKTFFPPWKGCCQKKL